MFMLIGLTMYSLFCLYTYFRFKAFFTKLNHKILFTIFFLLMAFSFPSIEIISHQNDPGWLENLIIPIYYILPFLLYSFILVMVFDLFRGVSILLRLIPGEVFKRENFRLITFGVIVFLSIAIVFLGVVNFKTIKISEYKISVPKGSAKIAGLKIAMAADFHLSQMTDLKFLEKFVYKINEMHPDLLLIPGDLVEGHNDGNTEEFARNFRQIKAKYGIYASLGNHDSHRNRNAMAFFNHANITVLKDSSILVEDSFYLVGRKDHRSFDRKPIADLLNAIPKNLPIIVLDHRPVDLETISKYHVDIQVSGHTHYGQLFPMNLIINWIYELGWGYKKLQNTNFFVTSGIQVWGPPVRTVGNSEIMLISVDFI